RRATAWRRGPGRPAANWTRLRWARAGRRRSWPVASAVSTARPPADARSARRPCDFLRNHSIFPPGVRPSDGPEKGADQVVLRVAVPEVLAEALGEGHAGLPAACCRPV